MRIPIYNLSSACYDVRQHMVQRILMVSNRLPIAVDTTNNPYKVNRSLGGLATSLSAVGQLYDTTWIGWAGNQKPLSKQQFAELSLPDNLVPVNIPRKRFYHYYDRVANAVMWPTLHSMKPPIQVRSADWNSVQSVVNLFAETIIRRLQRGDIIWIHDFHPMLLIHALRARGVTNKIGFFLHTPFPGPAGFMALSGHKRLLTSLAMADLVGFQTERDRTNFTSTLKKAGVRPSVQMESGVFPIGIDFDMYAKASGQPNVQLLYAALREQYTKQYIVLSISRLDYTKGILEQLQAFEKAVLKHSLHDITYRLIVAPSRESRIEYRRLERKIEHLVHAINKRLQRKAKATQISFEYRNHGFDEISAWYRLADMLLITPRFDGMNLVVKEYIAARSKPGTLVLSRTAGAAAQLQAAILVDPHEIENIAEGIYKAYAMEKDERAARWQAMRDNVRAEDIFSWATSFITTLQQNDSQHR